MFASAREPIDLSKTFIEMIEQRFGNEVPLFISGHSLGGLISIVLGMEFGSKVKGVIGLTPGLETKEPIRTQMNKFKGIAAFISWFHPAM